MADFAKLLVSKRKWEPIDPVYTPIPEGFHTTIGKALSLRILELSVADFVSNATKRELPIDSYGRDLLGSNIHDESVHDVALCKLANSMPFVCDYEEAVQFKSRIIELADITHPIEAARTLEAGVFFVILGLMRLLGNAAAKTVATDILGDESVHVATNTNISKEIKTFTDFKALDAFRREVVYWLTEDLDPNNVPAAYAKYANQQFWLDRSENLYYNNKDIQAKDVKKAAYFAFFEVDRRNQPVYR